MQATIKPANSLSHEQKFKVAKAIIVLISLSAFVCNSYLLFFQFMEGSTILSNDLITPEKGELQAPSILVCGKTSFKEMRLDTKISDFEENSLRLRDFLVDSLFVSGEFAIETFENVSNKWISFHTAYYGSCHKLELEKMMKHNNMIWVQFNMEKEFDVYVLGHKLDIFIPIFMWRKPPTYAKISRETIIADVKITKHLLIKNGKGCKDYDDKVYSYSDCVKNDFKDFYQENCTNCKNCTLPWTMSLLKTISDETLIENPCKDNATANSITFDLIKFFTYTRKNSLLQCKEPCQFTSYNTETISYDRRSIMAHRVLRRWFKMANMTFDTMDNRTILFFNYPSMDVEVSQKVKILNASSFISAVGGNLGLFIGFSFLDTLFAAYKWFCTRFTK